MYQNYGWIIILTLTLLGAIPYFIFKNFEVNLLKYKLNSVLKNDCLAFEPQKLSMNEYFILPRPVIHSRSWNHNRMMDAAFPKDHCKLNKNLALMDFEGNLISKKILKIKI